jgi:hypothetical protein
MRAGSPKIASLLRRLACPATLVLAIAVLMPPLARAAEAPGIEAAWVTGVSSGAANFHGEVNPHGAETTFVFEYATDQAFQEKGFTGAAKAPLSGTGAVGSGSGVVAITQHVSALRSGTLYHYQLSATNSAGTASLETNPAGAPLLFTTQPVGAAFALPDDRGWEMVSPPDKNGGAIQGPEQNHGGGVIEAAAEGGGEITYSSASSFGGYEANGAPPASQYVSSRTGSGWSTKNITPPAVSGSYGNEPNGVPYQLFSTDLARGLMLNGVHCRGEGAGCPVANPPLEGSGAPSGYQDYYLRENEDGTYTAILTSSNAQLGLEAEEFNLAFAGASPDLRHLVLSTCAAIVPGASEVSTLEGCDPTKQNLYEYSEGQLSLINVSPSATLAAQWGAVSADGSRVYFVEAGKLYLREAPSPPQLVAEGGEFQAASVDGSLAFYIKAGHLYRYDTATHSSTDLTPAGGVLGVLGASEDGATVYYQGSAALVEWHEGVATTVAASSGAALASDYPPTTGTARVSTDGQRLLFLSKESLTGYDNHDATTGLPDSEVFLWNATGGGLVCISCNPAGERPVGPSTISGSYSNGSAAAAEPGQIVTDSYKPRNLAATQNRAFFNTGDALVGLDTDKASDAYEWEAAGTGTCAKPGGCLALISSGTDPDGAVFLDASESGEDAYFLTSSSLVRADPGSRDVYDARVGGGFPQSEQPIECIGDACVPLPAGPEDPTVGSLISGLSNPPVHFSAKQCPKGTRKATRKGRIVCVARRKGHHQKKRGHR